MSKEKKGAPVLEIATIDPLFVARDIKDMKQHEIGFAYMSAIGTDTRKHKGVKNPIYIDGKAPILTAIDMITAEDDGGAVEFDEDHRDFVRVICLGKQAVKVAKNKAVVQKAYVIDGVHLNYGENVVYGNKLESTNWGKHDLMPLPVTQFIATALDLDHYARTYQAETGLTLPESALMQMSQER